MWEEYKEIEPRIIRPINGKEFFTSGCYLNILDIFPRFSIEEFRKRAQENLSKIKVFNHALKRIKGHLFIINKPFEVHIKEIPYTENEEIEKFLKKEDEWIILYEPIFDEEDKDVQILFYFKICQLEKSNQTKVTLSVSHVICDGRAAFNLFDLIRKIINGETLEKDNEALSTFDERERFQNVDESFSQPPEVWNEIKEGCLIPKINSMPYNYITRHYIYIYAPISKFCRANGVTVQSMLMAMMSRAARRFNNLPKETPLWSNTPIYTRMSPLATEEYKRYKYYFNTASIYPKIIGQDTLMKDIQHCMKQLQRVRKTNDDIRHIYSCGYIIDPETFQFNPKGRYPDIHFQNVINVSNIGKINGNNPIFYLSNDTVMPGSYNFFYHSYHTDDKLYIAGLSPIEMDKTFINYIKEEMDKIFIPEKILK
ncbi:hypothetical protein U3516DRAFT_562978 [Neocallimastix sp. 'constans']